MTTRIRSLFTLFGLTACLLSPGFAPAQEVAPATPALTAAATNAPAAAVEKEETTPMTKEMDLKTIIKAGGKLMYVLAAMSMLGLTFVAYFFVALSRRNVTPPEFVKDINVMLKYGRFNEARKACEKSKSPAAAITMAALDYLDRVDDPDIDLLKEVVEGEGSRQSSLISNQITYLMDIGVVAPMVGLLGTVIGMLRTFFNMDIATAQPVVLSQGVAQALITTAGGLIVGIPAMVFYAYFRGQSGKLISNMEAVATDLVTVIATRKKV